MAIGYGVEAPKPRPRVLDRVDYKRALEKRERDCRRAVKARDQGRCVIRGCRDGAKHAHHIQFRSQGGKWTSDNIVSLCVFHHQCVHAGLIKITGNANTRLKAIHI